MADDFREIVWRYYNEHRRDLPWRIPESDGSFDPYKILVSEVMLQQTQASRVVPKYHEFLTHFPTAEALAEARLGEVLQAWSGLGYNRRAKYLHDAAKQLVSKNRPWKYEELVASKGIGKNTAAAVCVYAYNKPLIFIETNIRTVYIHHFFPDRTTVSDKEILELIAKTLPKEQEEQPETWALPKPGAMRNPPGVSHYREWYWALMDYGTHLKKAIGNLSRRSKHYVRQSPLKGSRRQLRGQVLRLLIQGTKTQKELERHIADQRLNEVLQTLVDEALIKQNKQNFSLH